MTMLYLLLKLCSVLALRFLFTGSGADISSGHQRPADITNTRYPLFRLQPLLLQAPALQVHLRASTLVGPEGAGETVEDPSSDEERATTDGESEVEEEADEADLSPEGPWCLPIPDALDDPTEMEIKGAADKLATMINSSQPQANVFFQPDNLILCALSHLWLQAKLTSL